MPKNSAKYFRMILVYLVIIDCFYGKKFVTLQLYNVEELKIIILKLKKIIAMNIKQISQYVTYVGVDDRVKTLFEGLWPLPYGVSYNSYVVSANKKALIDTVEIGCLPDYLHNIGKEEIDYLVVNHVEPDHSGSIPSVLNHYPNLMIVTNKVASEMIKGYYGVDDSRFIIVKDGDILDLGGATLKFFTTPMVHWPETMMTYLEEDKVLFSGDAFGTFGALTGMPLDDDLDVTVYFEEMYRYYSNIVGKYGMFVQKALAKLADTKIDYICSTHGPIWHKYASKAIDITSRLSKYEPEDGVVIVYGSMYGNTEHLAGSIASNLAKKGVKNIKIHNASHSSMSELISDCFRYKGLIIGAPTYSMEIFPPIEQLLIALRTREIKNKTVGVFGSYTWGSAAHKKVSAYFEQMKLPVIANLDMKQSVRTLANDAIEQFANDFYCGLIDNTQ